VAGVLHLAAHRERILVAVTLSAVAKAHPDQIVLRLAGPFGIRPEVRSSEGLGLLTGLRPGSLDNTLTGSRASGGDPVRTGGEPSQARSALRLRAFLTILGLLCAVVGVVVFAVLRNIGWMVGFAVVALIAVLDLAIVLTRIRQGPHFQPGTDTPPYQPVESAPEKHTSRAPPTAETRKRRYLLLMGLCLTLFVLAWAWVRFYSTTAAVVMTIVAMTIPPLAVIVANAGSPINRRGGR
jgi:hypothetical protein